MEHLDKTLERKTFGLVLRVFAPKPELVASQCDRNLALARKAAAMKSGGKNVFRSIVIMVVSDKRRIDHDCGESATYLKQQLKLDRCPKISVHAPEQADIFCGILNEAAEELKARRCDYMAVFSNAASDYLDLQFMNDASHAFQNGAVAVGLAITELQASILKGALANTAMIWDLRELGSVGGFDHFAEQPFKPGHKGLFTDERQVNWMQGKREDGKDAFYACAGVEEIISLIRLARKHDRACIAPIMPSSGKIWELPTDPDQLVRHLNKMTLKTVPTSAISMTNPPIV
jgi:hypothetical protein